MDTKCIPQIDRFFDSCVEEYCNLPPKTAKMLAWKLHNEYYNELTNRDYQRMIKRINEWE